MLELRPYQREAIDALYAHWAAGKGNGLIVLPTGAGKSLVLAKICEELLRDYPTMRIGIVTHVKELIAQNFQELLRLWPQAGGFAGIYSAGVGRRDTRSKILFCGIQSVWNKVNLLGDFDLLLVDEAHLIPRNSETTYGRFIESLQERVPDMRVAGLTATPYRLDSGRLDRGEGRLFESVVYDANVGDLIEQGYLSPLISKATLQKLDVSGVKKSGGDFVGKALEVAVDQDWITRGAVKEIAEYGASRRAWLAFCSGVGHSEHVRDAIREAGFTSESVTGDTPKGERDSIIRRFREGHIRCLTSVGVLGTGFNVPHVDLVALLRPTQSAGLYVQQVGRALRKAPGKDDAIVLDFAGNVKRHGPIDCVTTKSATAKKGKSDEEAEARAKECPQCRELVALAARTCKFCGHEWPIDDTPTHDATADATSVIVARTAEPTWTPVDQMRLYLHEKHGSPASVRVEYRCGFVIYKEWLGFEHSGMMRQKAEAFWTRAAFTAIPRTATEAIQRAAECRTPSAIQVRPNGKYFDIVGRKFGRFQGSEGVGPPPWEVAV